jgi:integrase
MTHNMARPRLRKNRDLPDNLTYESARGLYRYRNPVTGKRTYLSNDRKACVRAAKELNQRLQPADASLVDRVVGGGQTFTMATYRYERDVMPDKRYSDKTAREQVIYLRKLRACALAKMAVSQIEVTHVVDALDVITEGRRMRNIYRQLLIQVFDCAIELGWCTDNPAAITRVVNETRQRQRLTMDGYRAIYQAGEPWLQVAMDLMLVTLQRPEDLVALKYSDISDGVLYIRQRKTGAKLAIAIGAELQAALAASRDGKLCPFIIHHRPRRTPTKPAAWREHPMQVNVEKLSKTFTAARQGSGFYADAKYPPTCYEIKSLGGDRYRQMGWSESDIQTLYGHSNQSMTAHYLAGHEKPWTPVGSG